MNEPSNSADASQVVSTYVVKVDQARNPDRPSNLTK